MANNNKKKNKSGANKKVKNTTPKEKQIKKEESKENKKVNKVKEAKKVESKQKTTNKVKTEKKDTLNKAKKELVYASNNNDEITKLVKLILLVTLIMVVFYFITSIVTSKANAKKVAQKKQSEAVTIQYENIIIGSMLNKDGDYYVLIEKEDDNNLSEYETTIQTISVNEEAPNIYKANLTDSFNKIYLSDTNNFDSNLENFKVSGTTLLKISNHQIAETYDNYDSIKGKLDELK